MRAGGKRFNLFFIGIISFILLPGFEINDIQEKLEEGDRLISAKKYAEAENILNEILQEVSKENPNPQEELSKNIVIPRIYFNLGAIQYKQEKFENAKSYFEKVLNFQFKSYWDVKAIYNMGLIDYDLKKYEEARKNFIRILAEYPDSGDAPQAQYYIGLCYELENNKADAKDAFKKFIELFPKHPWIEKVKMKLGQE
ncbi:MAG: tetratricopeptide repeat protein [bacterium]